VANLKKAIWIIDPKEAVVGYYMMLLLGAALMVGAAALVWAERSIQGYLLGVILALFGALSLAVGRLLGMKKGGIAFCPQTRRWLLLGAGERDVLEVPEGEVLGLAVERRTEYWGRSPEPVLVSSIHLMLRSGVRVLLLQMPTLVDAQERAEMIRDATGVSPLREGGVRFERYSGGLPSAAGLVRGAGEGEVRLRSGVAGALGVTLGTATLFCLASGGLLLASLSVSGIVGALFGPLLLFLGIAFGAFLVVRIWGWQEVSIGGEKLRQGYRLGRWRWGKQEVDVRGESVMTRVVNRGVHGFSVEVLQGEKMAIVGSGATAGGPLPPVRLLEFGGWLMARLSQMGLGTGEEGAGSDDGNKTD